MQIQTIKAEIDIRASRERVWEVLLHDIYTSQWYSIFSEGTHVDTDWQEGSKAIFTDASGNGMTMTVVKNIPYELMSLEYQGMVIDGEEDFTSDIAMDFKGGMESYHLSGNKPGYTKLSIESDMSDEYADSMTISWEKALKKIKNLAEGSK